MINCTDTCCRPELDAPEYLALSERTHRAKVRHPRCGLCPEPIEAGQSYRVENYLLDGEFFSDKKHTACVNREIAAQYY